jgi:hypothetical protein
MMPDAKELARIRADMQNYTLPDVGNILQKTQVSDGEGGITDTWGTVTANVPCRLDLVISRGVGLIGMETVQAAALKTYSSWIVSLPHGTAIKTANRFEKGGETFNVVDVDAPRSWLGNVRATLEKV